MPTLVAADKLRHSPGNPRAIELPAPTAWPIVLGFGLTLLFAGLLTDVSVSVLGAVLSFAGCVGWFCDVFPHEQEELVEIELEDEAIATERQRVERIHVDEAIARAWLPLETYPISAGVKGGWAGSVAMAVLACIYGLVKTGSIWYPINLLAAGIYTQSMSLEPAQLNAFHAGPFVTAVILHGIVSTLVGLLYGAMLPMFPRQPILLGGLIAPALWSGLLYSILGLLNPVLESHINWFWFMASQIGFGVVAGLVVMRQSRVPTRENLPFAVRAGIEAPGMMRQKENGEKHS
ncbi:MAG TPA: hypothetical protein VNI81_10535 [Candidatus Limnocylindrales bacterium]|nr:hypothetical protein [Candidatus Limnocylindrales bacterium]